MIIGKSISDSFQVIFKTWHIFESPLYNSGSSWAPAVRLSVVLNYSTLTNFSAGVLQTGHRPSNLPWWVYPQIGQT
jgi:hypothetical protein